MTESIELPRLLCEPGPTYVRGPCRHATGVVPVDCVDGTVVAQLCTSCDTQLPADLPLPLCAPTFADINTELVNRIARTSIEETNR